jgi:hypothetical protein
LESALNPEADLYSVQMPFAEEHQWRISMSSYLSSLGENFSPLIEGRCALTLESPRCLFFSIRSEDTREFNELEAVFDSGQPAMYWFDGYIAQGDFGIPAVVVKILKSMNGPSNVAFGETVACYYSPIPQDLEEYFRDALRASEMFITSSSSGAVLVIPA